MNMQVNVYSFRSTLLLKHFRSFPSTEGTIRVILGIALFPVIYSSWRLLVLYKNIGMNQLCLNK